MYFIERLFACVSHPFIRNEANVGSKPTNTVSYTIN